MKSLLAASAMAGFLGLAQAQVPMKFHLEISAADGLGDKVAYLFKNELQRNRMLSYVDDPEQAKINIKFVSVEGVENRLTAYSVAWVVGQDFFWDHSVGVCGATKINSCALGLAAETEKMRVKVANALRK